jgi:hypothetical protein
MTRGVTLDDLEEARRSALDMITALARGKDEDRRDSRVSIREGDGPVLMAIALRAHGRLVRAESPSV